MVAVAVSPLLDMLSHRLHSEGYSHKMLRNLKIKLYEIKMLARDAENQRTDNNREVVDWMTKVKDAAHDMDNLLDDFISMNNCRLRCCFSLDINFCPVIERKLQQSIRDVEERLTVLAHYSIKDIYSPDVYSSSNFFNEVIDRVEDMDVIMGRLFNGREQLNVIPLVGIGGIGKTALARLVYNTQQVHSTYDILCWIDVGQKFDLKLIGEAIIEKFRHIKIAAPIADLEYEVKLYLSRVKFLIVLDDVWEEEYIKWKILTGWFKECTFGSAVILTTRSGKVGVLKGVPHYLQVLSDDQCWSLLENIVPFSSMETENNKMAQIARRLVMKCKGLPIAVVTLGGILTSRISETEWMLLDQIDLWNLPNFESPILSVLKRSYYVDLPSRLKQCFAYFSMFPKDHSINKERLIQQWISEGFVQSSDIGESYFNEFLLWCFFRETERNDFGEIVACRMHDCIHALVRSVASNTYSTVDIDGDGQKGFKEEVRYACITCSSGSSLNSNLLRGSKLQTLLLYSTSFDKIPRPLLELKSLRMLGLSGSKIKKLSASVSNLIHLQHLDLSCTDIATLPHSIRKLKNLQTLNLAECYNLQELPEAVCKLVQLRVLDNESCCSLSSMPSGIGKLEYLQKLPLYILTKNDGHGSIYALSRLTLSGKLEIKNLQYVKIRRDNSFPSLHGKDNLRSLKLSWGGDCLVSREMDSELLNLLEPPVGLKFLDLEGYGGGEYPWWMMKSTLINLTCLYITNCSFGEFPPLQNLPNLKDLYIKGMHEVEYIQSKFHEPMHFLKRIELYDMPNLQEWTSQMHVQVGQTSLGKSATTKSIEVFPCLKSLIIEDCGKLKNVPRFLNLSCLGLRNNNPALFDSVAYLKSLESLAISDCQEKMVLPNGLHSINKVTLYNCSYVESLLEKGNQCFPYLKLLNILYCDKLVSVDLRRVPFLKKLHIVECHDLISLVETPHFLQDLIIEGCPVFTSIPKSLVSLKKLVISGCPILTEHCYERIRTR